MALTYRKVADTGAELARAMADPPRHPLRERMDAPTDSTDVMKGTEPIPEQPKRAGLFTRNRVAVVDMHTSPKFGPPREDLRRHVDKELKHELENDPDLQKEASMGAASLFNRTAAIGVNAAAEKLAWTNALKKEVLQRWGNTEGMKELAEGNKLDAFLTKVESLCPVGAAKLKVYTLYLCQQYFGFNPPAWVPGEDDHEVRPLLHNFDKLCIDGTLQGPEADILTYKAFDALKSKVKEALGQKDEADVQQNDDAAEQALASTEQYSTKRTKYLPEELEIIKNNTEVLLDEGGWTILKVPQNPTPEQAQAMHLLCNNGINKVTWCVGRGTASYFNQGPFYVCVTKGRSKYAISTVVNQSNATIWNPADTPIWVTTSGGSKGMRNLQAAAQEKGIPLDMSKVSSLPEALIAPLQAAVQKDPILAKMIPTTHLVKGDNVLLDRSIMATPLKGLVSDLAEAFGSERSMGLGSAVLGRCIAMHYDFSEEYSEFTEQLLVAYIELLAAAGQGLPKSLEDAICEAIEASA